LGKVPNQSDPYVLGARARIRVADVADAITRLRAAPSDARQNELADAVDEAERAIARASNVYPGDPELLQAEARLREELGDTEDAVRLLQKAWEKMPRGSGVAMQLARKYVDQGEPERALKTLREAISRDPTDRSLNRMVANILFTLSGDINDEKAKSYLIASFVEGDREHWGRFLRAAHAYATGDYKESERLFEDLNQRAPPDFRPQLNKDHEWLTAALRGRRGTIAKSFGSYFLITPTTGPDDLYAPEWATDVEFWEVLGVRSSVRFDIGFGRRGPFARDVRPAI
jgi:tetratricopeptide (TPR) repeat protein